MKGIAGLLGWFLLGLAHGLIAFAVILGLAEAVFWLL